MSFQIQHSNSNRNILQEQMGSRNTNSVFNFNNNSSVSIFENTTSQKSYGMQASYTNLSYFDILIQ